MVGGVTAVEGVFVMSKDYQLLWRARARALEVFPLEQVPKMVNRNGRNIFAILPSGADQDSHAYYDHVKALRNYLDEYLPTLYKSSQSKLEILVAEPIE